MQNRDMSLMCSCLQGWAVWVFGDMLGCFWAGSHGVQVAADGEGFDRRGGSWTRIGRGGWSRIR